MGQATVLGERFGERLAAEGDQLTGQGTGTGHGYLLAEDRPHGELGTVGAPRDAPSRCAAHERREERICTEDGDGYRIRVEVQEAAASLHRGAEIPQVLQPEPAPDVVIA